MGQLPPNCFEQRAGCTKSANTLPDTADHDLVCLANAAECEHDGAHMSMLCFSRSDTTLTNLANALGVLSVVLIVVYQFFDVAERRQALAQVVDASKAQ